MKKILAILICLLFAGSALAQDLPLTQKQWYGIGVIGEPPETSSYNTITDQTAYLTGLVNAAGNTCFAGAASAACYMYVSLAGPLGAVGTKAFDGTVIPVTDIGLEVISGNYFWSKDEFEVIYGDELGSDDISTSTDAPYVGGFLHLYDTVGANWDRGTAHAAGDALSATQAGLDVLSHNLFYDGTNHRRWLGFQSSVDNIAGGTAFAPATESLLYGSDGTNWDRLTVNSAGDSLSSTQQALDVLGYTLFHDGTNYRRWQGVTAADDLTLPTAPHVLSTMMAYDGATLDMLRVGGVGELEVTDVATRPGEDAGNDWRKVKKESVATYSPAKETTTGVGTAATTVLASKEILDWPDWCVYLENDDGADPFTDADVQVSPDDSTWISLTWTACDALAFGEACVYCATNSAYRYVRVQVAAADANQVDVDAWITANTN